MKRWLGFSICTALGVALFVCGLRIPIYLRAVDAVVLQRAGKNTSSLADFGLKLVNDKNLGAAQLILQTAQTEKISGWEKLGATVTDSVNAHPDWEVWGGDVRWNQFFEKNLNAPANSEPFTAFAIREQNRDSILQALRQSSNPATLELLRTRALNDTVLFPPSQSASGQAYDAAVAIAGLLTEGGYLTASLSGDISKLAAAANQGHGTRPLEEVLMDLLSLGQRLNWNQLVTFVNQIADVPTLHLLADQARKSGHELPLLFSAVTISSQPDGVAKYLSNYNATGFGDLAAGLHFGAGGLQELLARDQRIYHSGNLPQVGLSLSLRAPWLAFALKWFLYLVAGFLFAASLHFVKPAVSSLERPLQVRGFHVFREILFALGFLLVVLLLSEPFLAQENQKETFSFRLHLPTTGSVVTTGFLNAHPTLMNNLILLTLLLFFVLQGLIYIACLVKLAEIRRQNIPPRMKLKLLENEDHLFDAGLYLGFVGTIVSLILVSMGVIKFSLMAAYSSTSFGIVFVCVFKIFNLRPARRRLLLEAEALESSQPALATQS